MDAAPAPGKIISEVREVISEALKRKELPPALSRRGIAGLAKQVARAEVRRTVSSELGGSDPSAGIGSLVRDALSEATASDAISTDHGQSHPFWHILRSR